MSNTIKSVTPAQLKSFASSVKTAIDTAISKIQSSGGQPTQNPITIASIMDDPDLEAKISKYYADNGTSMDVSTYEGFMDYLMAISTAYPGIVLDPYYGGYILTQLINLTPQSGSSGNLPEIVKVIAKTQVKIFGAIVEICDTLCRVSPDYDNNHDYYNDLMNQWATDNKFRQANADIFFD